MIRRIKSKSLGRLELLSWLNDFLEADYSKVEHLGDGIAYCQIVDSCYPGKVPLEKLNFNSTYVEQRVKNLKVLQNVLAECGVKKEVPAKSLAACKFQSNLAFLQWAYAFLNEKYPDAVVNYRAYERRQVALDLQKQRRSRRGGKKGRNRDSRPRVAQRQRLDGGGGGGGGGGGRRGLGTSNAQYRSPELAPSTRGSPGSGGSRAHASLLAQHEMAESMLGNLNLVPKSYTMRPGTKKTPPRNTVSLAGKATKRVRTVVG